MPGDDGMTRAPAVSSEHDRPRRGRILQAALILTLVLPRLILIWNGFAAPQRSLLTDSAGYLELAESIRLEGRCHAS